MYASTFIKLVTLKPIRGTFGMLCRFRRLGLSCFYVQYYV